MCGLEQAFNKTFQTHVMGKHMKNPLFKEIPFEKEVESKGEKKDLDENIETIMEETLSQVANIASEQKFQCFFFKSVC
jgi:hypothetical protein